MESLHLDSNTTQEIEKEMVLDSLDEVSYITLRLKVCMFGVRLTSKIVDKSSVKWYGEYGNKKELLETDSFDCVVFNPEDYDGFSCEFDYKN